jgi:hypothetical protein
LSNLIVGIISDGSHKTWGPSLCNYAPVFCYPTPSRLKYLPQHPILDHPQCMFFPEYERPSFTPT